MGKLFWLHEPKTKWYTCDTKVLDINTAGKASSKVLIKCKTQI